MKAVIVESFTRFDEARVTEVEDPRPGNGEVVVHLAASDVNFPDMLYIEGKYQNLPPLPFSPGFAGAGIVASVGDDLHKWPAKGDRVLVIDDYGTYAEQIKVAADHCFPIPDDMPFEVAAACGLVYQTAWFALTHRARLAAGESVLVLGGTGGIGMASIQLAKALGAGKVIAVSRGKGGCELARQMGADIAIDGLMQDPRNELRAAVLDATDGNGVDVVIDPVGGDLAVAVLRAMAWQGRMVVVGFASGTIPQLPANYLLVRTIEVSGLQWTDYRDRKPEAVRAAQHSIFALWREGKLNPRISATYPLEQYADALRQLHEGRGQGKVILSMQSGKET